METSYNRAKTTPTNPATFAAVGRVGWLLQIKELSVLAMGKDMNAIQMSRGVFGSQVNARQRRRCAEQNLSDRLHWPIGTKSGH